MKAVRSGVKVQKTKTPPSICFGGVFIGAPGTIRTSDPQIRSLMLYPAELRARIGGGDIEAVSGDGKPVASAFSRAYTAGHEPSRIFAADRGAFKRMRIDAG
ncbi:hypothetical protein SPHINGOAX6_40429 [Sphingomonas sp. AX6]|nr:hypothetical protein SPHINGOAX6_40429 [Sphingomonas sp. AX6]